MLNDELNWNMLAMDNKYLEICILYFVHFDGQ